MVNVSGTSLIHSIEEVVFVSYRVVYILFIAINLYILHRLMQTKHDRRKYLLSSTHLGFMNPRAAHGGRNEMVGLHFR
jgi:hypothetical protein